MSTPAPDRVPKPNPDPNSEPTRNPDQARITLIGKPGCHLCDDARAVVSRVSDDTGVGWSERSILDDPALLEQYGEQIPVVLVDGEQHDFWRVDEERLRAALRGRRRWWGRRNA